VSSDVLLDSAPRRAGADFTLRDAGAADAAVLLDLVRQLAVFERAPDAVRMTEADLGRALSGTPPLTFALIAEQRGWALGAVLWFHAFSTWTGRGSISIEDVFVIPEARGQGVGRALFRELARRAKAMGFARLDWRVLDWNSEAINFYQGIGAEAQTEWTGYRLAGAALDTLAA
jgi:GNAT superfamily N-acetyltransferase